MGKVIVQDGAVIPEALKRQAEADDKAQEAEIAAHKVSQVVKPATEEPVEKPTDILPAVEPVAVTPVPKVDDLSAPLAEMKRELALERQRNQTLQGRIDVIGPQAAEQTRMLREQVEALTKRLDAPPPEPTVEPQLKHLTVEEREIYASGDMPVEAKMARGIVEDSVTRLRAEAEAGRAELMARIATIEQGTAGDRQDNHTKMIMANVEELLPGAIVINKDRVFIDWLKNTDPRSTTGASYEERGAAAMDRGDSFAIAELMKEYKGQSSTIDPVIAGQIRPEPVTVASSVIPPEKVQVSESEAAAFFQDKAHGKCRNPDGSPMTKEQIDETEKIIDLAIQEGRIIGG